MLKVGKSTDATENRLGKKFIVKLFSTNSVSVQKHNVLVKEMFSKFLFIFRINFQYLIRILIILLNVNYVLKWETVGVYYRPDAEINFNLKFSYTEYFMGFALDICDTKLTIYE